MNFAASETYSIENSLPSFNPSHKPHRHNLTYIEH